jgi:hypothetical protein
VTGRTYEALDGRTYEAHCMNMCCALCFGACYSGRIRTE